MLPLVRLKNEDGTYADIIGIKGDKGDPGVSISKTGFFTLEGDEEGNLYAVFADDDTTLSFETDDTGNIYVDMGDE
jgi:hypothetical protein